MLQFRMLQLIPAAALLLILNACGSDADSSSESSQQNSGLFGYAQNGSGSNVACSSNVNGVKRQGKTQAECDALKTQVPGTLPPARNGGAGSNGGKGTAPQGAPGNPGAPVNPGSQGNPRASGEDASAGAGGADGSDSIVCVFNINGKVMQGQSQAECDKLQKDLGVSFDIPQMPPFPPMPPFPQMPTFPGASQQGGGDGAVVSCSFNINGKLYQGHSQAECDKLQRELGSQF